MRRVAFISTMGSHTAKAFLSSWPDSDFNLPTDAWHMVFCTYLGLDVPFLKKFVGRLIGTSATARVDAHGMALASAKLPGDHWRIRHDVVKHAILFAVRGMGIAVNCEVSTSLRRLSRQQLPSTLPARILLAGARGWSRTSNLNSIRGSWARSRASFLARSCTSTGPPWW